MNENRASPSVRLLSSQNAFVLSPYKLTNASSGSTSASSRSTLSRREGAVGTLPDGRILKVPVSLDRHLSGRECPHRPPYKPSEARREDRQLRSLKFSSSRRPCSVQTDSGWN